MYSHRKSSDRAPRHHREGLPGYVLPPSFQSRVPRSFEGSVTHPSGWPVPTRSRHEQICSEQESSRVSFLQFQGHLKFGFRHSYLLHESNRRRTAANPTQLLAMRTGSGTIPLAGKMSAGGSNKSVAPMRLVFFFVEACFDRRLNFFVESLVVFQHFLRRIAALRQLCALIVQPGTAFFDDLFFQRKIEQRAGR